MANEIIKTRIVMENNQINDDNLLSLSWKEQVLYLANNGAEERIVRALIRTMPESEWSQLEGENTPGVVRDRKSVV